MQFFIIEPHDYEINERVDHFSAIQDPTNIQPKKWYEPPHQQSSQTVDIYTTDNNKPTDTAVHINTVDPEFEYTNVDFHFKKLLYGIITSLCLDIFFHVDILILQVIFIVIGFVYFCTFQLPFLLIYGVSRYISCVIIFAIAITSGLSEYGILAAIVNVILTVYDSYVICVGLVVYEDRSAEDIKKLWLRQDVDEDVGYSYETTDV